MGSPTYWYSVTVRFEYIGQVKGLENFLKSVNVEASDYGEAEDKAIKWARNYNKQDNVNWIIKVENIFLDDEEPIVIK